MMHHDFGQVHGARGACPRRRSVALVGMDGSGKSTQSVLLSAALRGQGKRVLLIHPFGRKLLAFLPAGPTARMAREAASASGSVLPLRRAWKAGWSKRLSAVVELLDVGAYVWIAYAKGFFLSQFRKNEVWLVSDRSFDDLLIKHRRRRTLSARALRVARRLVPQPEKTIWLQTQPAVAMARDREFDASYYEELDAEYAAGAREHGWEVVPTSDLSPEEVWAKVESVLRLRAEQADQTRATWSGPRASANEISSRTQASETR